MIMAVHPLTAPTRVDSHRDDWTCERSGRMLKIRPARLPDAPRDQTAEFETDDLDAVLGQMYYMNLASLRSYHELSRMVTNPDLRNFVEIMVRQRTAQCQALALMSHSLNRGPINLEADEDALQDPRAAEVRVIWLRAVWSYEQEEFGRFSELVLQAEELLEDSCLEAADLFHSTRLANLFLQQALNVCGARQRLEELAAAVCRP